LRAGGAPGPTSKRPTPAIHLGRTVGLAIGDHDGSLLIVDRVGRVEFVVGLRSHTGEVLSVYLTDVDVEKLIDFLTWKHD
jgi:hypothetical protein